MTLTATKTRRAGAGLTSPLALILALGVGACDGQRPQRDVSAPASVHTEEITIRIDAPDHGPASASVLAFRAEVAGLPEGHVLGAVDPLMVAPPTKGCVLHAVDETSNQLKDRAGWVELQPSDGLAVDFGQDNATLLPAPTVYPDLATVVAGVVSEAGPTELFHIPEQFRVRFGDGAEQDFAIPTLGRVTNASGGEFVGGDKLSVASDLQLRVTGPSGTYLEIRPFGATSWAVCALGDTSGDGQRSVRVPASVLQTLARLSGEVPVSLDVVWRSALLARGQSSHVTLETRTTALVELEP